MSRRRGAPIPKRGKKIDVNKKGDLIAQVQSLLKGGQAGGALKLLKQAIPTLPPQKAAFLWALQGEIYFYTLNQPDQAAKAYRKALKLTPDLFPALSGLGVTLSGTDKEGESLLLLEKALKINPNAWIPLLFSVAGRVRSSDQRDRAELIQRIEHFLKQNPPLPDLFRAAYWVPFLEMDRDLEQRIQKRIRNILSPFEQRQPPPKELLQGRKHERIRVGYFSPNFGNHAIGHVTKRLFESHNRDRFEIQVYSTARQQDKSEFGEHIRKTCDRYIDIGTAAPARVQEIVRGNEVDILVDLCGYMENSQILETFTYRPAPVQVYWLGHGGGLGMPFYDYIIGDPTVTPQEDDAFYVEAVARLPEVFAPADRHEISDIQPSRAEVGLKDDTFVFCAFNNPTKIDPKAFTAWMQILKEVPESQLWLSAGNGPLVSDNLHRAAKANGVDLERLVFAHRVPDKRDHFARLQLADLYLDTFTVSAATTAIDVLWAGVPVLARPGTHFCSRIGASMVKAVGLENMICYSTEEYIQRAVQLARSPQELAQIREQLWSHRDQATLFNPKRFTTSLEAAYTQMWERAQWGQVASSFDA